MVCLKQLKTLHLVPFQKLKDLIALEDLIIDKIELSSTMVRMKPYETMMKTMLWLWMTISKDLKLICRKQS